MVVELKDIDKITLPDGTVARRKTVDTLEEAEALGRSLGDRYVCTWANETTLLSPPYTRKIWGYTVCYRADNRLQR